HMRRLVTIAVLSFSVLLASAAPAVAGNSNQKDESRPPHQQGDGNVLIVVGTDGGVSGQPGGGSGGSDLDCTVSKRIPSMESSFDPDPLLRAGEAEEGRHYLLLCVDANGDLV